MTLWWAFLLGMNCTACVAPATRVDEVAAYYGFERQTVLGTKFFHRIYLNRKKLSSGVLHVYIEGDGLPWLNSDRVSPDPTPRNPLMLRLMAQDKESSIYLGRPCYFGFAQTQPCNSWWWTDGRYSLGVVDSMAAALAKFIPALKPASVVLIGHSGGGALAMLLAVRPIKVKAVVTLAGNLDIEAWAQLHHFSDLSGSLNPALMEPLDMTIVQMHFLGGKDQNIPSPIVSRFARHQPRAYFKMYQDFDHRCCWAEKWGEILERLSALDVSKRI